MKRRHPEDLENDARNLRYRIGVDGAKQVGVGTWRAWCLDIEEGSHPSARELAAFLRGFSSPLDGWLPEGMAEYLADRLVGRHPKPKGGRYPKRLSGRGLDEVHSRRVAEHALLAWEAHRKAGSSYPQETAFQDVADQLGVDLAEVRLAFHEHRITAATALSAALHNTLHPSEPRELTPEPGDDGLSQLRVRTLNDDAVSLARGAIILAWSSVADGEGPASDS